MLELNSKHADVLELFKKGFHVIRRTGAIVFGQDCLQTWSWNKFL